VEQVDVGIGIVAGGFFDFSSEDGHDFWWCPSSILELIMFMVDL
jgi:hypothetical protein